MSIEQHPLFRAAQAPFEESAYARRAALAQVDADFTARAEQAAQQQAAHKAEVDALVERSTAAQQQAPEQPKPTWQREERSTVLSFGVDDLHRDSATPTDAIPVQHPAPLPEPPLPVPPAPERPRTDQYLSFSVEDEEESTPPAPLPPPHAPQRRSPRPAARSAEQDDDGDWSERSWMNR